MRKELPVQKNRISIIGCGNPLMGNDGAGYLTMQALEGVCPGVDCIDGGTGGFGLIPLMEEYERVVIVDAMTGIGDRIGDVVILETPPVHAHPACSLHDIGVGEAVAVARELGHAGEIVVVGIEAGEIRAFTREVDPAVREGIRVAGEHILRIIGEWADDAGRGA